VSEGPARLRLLERSARRAALRERFTAPANALQAFAEMLFADARERRVPAQVIADVERIAACADDLVERLAGLEQVITADGDASEDALVLARHDLRTPVAAIHGYCELLIEDGAPLRLGDLERLLHATADFLASLDELGAAAEGGGARRDAAVSLARVVDRLERSFTSGENLHGRILVIDDHGANRDLLRELLERDGHSVTTAGDGSQGLAKLRADEFDLVLLDLIMPGMSGFDVLLAIQADPQLREMPVIVVTGLDDAAGLGRCLAEGAQDFLRKPFDAPVLKARLAANLDRKRLRDRERGYRLQLEAEKRTADELLRNILPDAVVARLSRGERHIADRLEDVTILFADIVGFTEIAVRLDPGQLVADLDRIVSRFDELASRHGVEKIKTVGDAYLAAAGLTGGAADHACAAAELALAMQGALETLRPRLVANYAIRVGLHSGPVLAGIIGHHKFTYDVWGDTVNIAARLQTMAGPGEIWVSGHTAERLRRGFAITSRGLVELRGRGELEAFALTARRG
jgi:class 3 adenylate cyclase